MKEIVIRKTIILSVIGVMFFIIGIVYGILSNDRAIMVMSGVICIATIWKVVVLHKIHKENDYTVISGICLGTSFKIVGRYRTVRIQTDKEIVELSVPKSVHLKINEEYNLYFKKNTFITEECSDWLKNKILSENFLGFELVGGGQA